jgi:hypothetical protein
LFDSFLLQLAMKLLFRSDGLIEFDFHPNSEADLDQHPNLREQTLHRLLSTVGMTLAVLA